MARRAKKKAAKRRRRRKGFNNAAALKRWPGVTIPIEECDTYYFDHDEADRRCAFFPEMLQHFEGEHHGQPFELLDWQAELVVRPLFGWKRRDNGRRRFKRLFLFIAKKNGKTELLTGVCLCVFYLDDEKHARVFSVATDVEQARLSFDKAAEMVEAQPELNDVTDVSKKSLVYQGSTFKVLSKIVRGKHGPNVSTVLFDELHAQPNREVYDALEKGTIARRQPLILMASHAGDDQESICYEEYERARDIIAGQRDDPSYLPVVFEMDPSDDWRKEEAWKKVNPSYGVCVHREYFEDEVRAAKDEPRKLNAFLRFHLNKWTQATTAWIPVEWWDRCKVDELPPIEKGQVVTGGVDLSAVEDLTAAVILQKIADDPEEEGLSVPVKWVDDDGNERTETLNCNFKLVIRPWFWLPKDTLHERVKDDNIPYDVWEREGHLTATAGGMVDHDLIVKTMLWKLQPEYSPQEWGADSWNATMPINVLEKKGMQIVVVNQTLKHLSWPAKMFEAMVKTGRVIHDGNPVMRRCIENATVYTDPNDNIRPKKPSRKKRIDGVSATITGMARLLVASEPDTSWDDYEPELL